MNIPEILEKGLMIGFGLTVLVIIFSFFNPILSIFYNNEKIQNYDKFVSTLDYGVKNSKDNIDKQITFSCFLSEQVEIYTYSIGDHFTIEINSVSKNSTIYSNNSVIFNQVTISNKFLMEIQFHAINDSISVIFLED